MEKLSIDQMKKVSGGYTLNEAALACLDTCYWWNAPCSLACYLAF